MEDTSKENGCLRLVENSHKHGILPHDVSSEVLIIILFSNGYTFNVGDSIKISKFTDDSNYIFEITNVITKNKKVFQPSNEIFDLSDKKFHNLNNTLVTNYLIADSAGIYILTLKNDRNTFHDVFLLIMAKLNLK